MKVVSLEIAKVIREAGYPQEYTIGDSWCYENGQCPDESETEPPMNGWVLLPAYLEVWLWLWREKKISITVDETTDDFDGEIIGFTVWAKSRFFFEKDDPEEAIIEAIEYLVENKLLK